MGRRFICIITRVPEGISDPVARAESVGADRFSMYLESPFTDYESLTASSGIDGPFKENGLYLRTSHLHRGGSEILENALNRTYSRRLDRLESVYEELHEIESEAALKSVLEDDMLEYSFRQIGDRHLTNVFYNNPDEEQLSPIMTWEDLDWVFSDVDDWRSGEAYVATFIVEY